MIYKQKNLPQNSGGAANKLLGAVLALLPLFLLQTAAQPFAPSPSTGQVAMLTADTSTAKLRLIDLPFNDSASAILGGHLSILLPQGTLEQRRGEIEPGAPLEDASRTNLIVAAGDERLLIRTFEIFQKYHDDFEKEGRSYLKGHVPQLGKMIVEPMRLPGKLKALAFQPESIVVNRQAIFLMGLLIAHPDSSIQEIRFFCNRPAVQSAADLVSIVRRIAKSVRPGASFVRQTSDSIKLAGTQNIQLPLQRRFYVTSQRGTDFTVDRLALPARLGSFAGKLGIYSGPQPSYQYHSAEKAGEQKLLSGTILGQTVEWRYWTEMTEDGERSARLIEAIVRHPHESGHFLHIFASAITPEQLELLRQQAEEIVVVP